MKKMFFIIAIVVVAISGNAQLKFGVKGGLNVSNITGKYTEGYRSKIGLHLGGLANLTLTEKLSVQGELLYSAQGARWDDDDEKTMLGYMQLPILVRYKIAGGFYAEAGPQFGLLVRAKDDNEGDVYDIKEYLKKSDISLAMGVGYDINSNLGVYSRYTAGLTSFYDTEKNSVFQLGVSYTFPRHKK
jgi:hypothetical protein